MFTIRAFKKTESEYQTLVAIRCAAYPSHPMALETFKHLDTSTDPNFLYQCELIEQDGETVAYAFYLQPTWAFHPAPAWIDFEKVLREE